MNLTLPKADDFKIPQINRRVIWVYGKPFSGKSTLAASAPNPFFLSTDGNAQYTGKPYVEIKDIIEKNGRLTERTLAWDVFKGYIDLLEDPTSNNFDTIIVDLLNDTHEHCRLYKYKELGISHESDDTYRAWDKVRTEYLSTIRKVCGLPYKNIILISHEDDTKDFTSRSGEKYTSIKPKMQDKVADAIAGMTAFVGRCFVENGEYKISLTPSDVVFGGGRLNTGNIVIPNDWNEIEKLFDNYNATC